MKQNVFSNEIMCHKGVTIFETDTLKSCILPYVQEKKTMQKAMREHRILCFSFCPKISRILPC